MNLPEHGFSRTECGRFDSGRLACRCDYDLTALSVGYKIVGVVLMSNRIVGTRRDAR